VLPPDLRESRAGNVPDSSEPLTLRLMRAEDLDVVERIEQAAHSHPWSRELLRRELDHDWSTVLVAEDASGTIHGYLVYWVVHDEIHILNVATDPDRRRKGVGITLMLAAEERSKPRRVTISTLEVRRSNAAAIGLYQKLGYEHVGVRPRYYADNQEDALVMTKTLTP